MPDFRNLARTHLSKAEVLLASGDDDDLELAALKLRKCMEALTYERSKIYADDLGPKTMKTWQPRKLMERMLEVDPYADQSATIRLGEEPSPGERPKVMREMGIDHVLDMRTLKKHYDALGAYLHTETLDQLENGKAHDMGRLRKRCIEIAAAAKTVLSSRIWNSSMASRGQIECHECKATIRRRVSRDGTSRVVECWDCPATYTMSLTEQNKVLFEPRMHEIACLSEACDDTFPLWEKELERGVRWKCRKCGFAQRLALGVTIDETASEDDS